MRAAAEKWRRQVGRGNTAVTLYNTWVFIFILLRILCRINSTTSSLPVRLCQLGRTEHLNNTSSPSFSQRLRIDYHFEKVQNLKFGIYDIDNSSADLGDDDYLGGVELTLGQVHNRPTCIPDSVKMCFCFSFESGSDGSSHIHLSVDWTNLNLTNVCLIFIFISRLHISSTFYV